MNYPPVVVYTTPTCPWCVRAKQYLTEKGVPFTTKDVTSDRAAAMEMVQRSGQTGVPVITVGNDTVVGFDRARLDVLLATERRPSFGAAVADASKITAKNGGIPMFGAYVGKVSPGSAAQRAGLVPGDIITEVNLRRVSNADDLTEALSHVAQGGVVALVWTRGAQALHAQVTLGSN